MTRLTAASGSTTGVSVLRPLGLSLSMLQSSCLRAPERNVEQL